MPGALYAAMHLSPASKIAVNAQGLQTVDWETMASSPSSLNEFCATIDKCAAMSALYFSQAYGLCHAQTRLTLTSERTNDRGSEFAVVQRQDGSCITVSMSSLHPVLVGGGII